MGRILSVSLVFGVVIFLLLPGQVTVINDDFGYLRSVVASIQHHRPWTDDWLEPWSASLCGLSALLYGVTGSFYLSTYGLLGLLAAAVFFLLVRCLMIRGWNESRSLMFAAAWLTIPTCLWKLCEFTGVPLYLACFLAALWSWERKAWGPFVVAWVIGLATRQSAITWSIFPLMELGLIARQPDLPQRNRRAWSQLLVLAAGLAAFALLLSAMNSTHSQRMITGHLLDRASWRVFGKALFTGTGVYLAAVGISGFVTGLTSRTITLHRSMPRRVGFGVMLILLLGVGLPDWVGVEHTLYQGLVGSLYIKALLVASACGLWFTPIRVDWRYALSALAVLCPLCLREAIWDYYLVEIGVLGVLGLNLLPETSPADPLPPGRRAARLAIVIGVSLASTLFLLRLKAQVDRAAGVCTVGELALREGKLSPTDISFAPFGFIAWQWYPYYIAHEGRNHPDIDGFGRYLNYGAVEVGQGYSKILRVLPAFRHVPPVDRTTVIDWGRFRFMWFFQAEYHLVRMPPRDSGRAETVIDQTLLPRFSFPLNDREWDRFIQNGSRLP